MRKLCILGGAAVALLTFSALALAATTQRFDASLKRSVSKPGAIKLKIDVGTNDDDLTKQPPSTAKATIFFGKGISFNGSKFATCDPASITAAKSTAGCPKGAIIGKGTASGLVARGNPARPSGIVQSDLTVTAVNGPGGKSISLFVQGNTPLKIQSNIVGTLKSATGKYARKLVVPIPANLQSSPAGAIALTSFVTTIEAKASKGGKSYSYVQRDKAKCPKGGYLFRGTFDYVGGTSTSVDDKVACF